MGFFCDLQEYLLYLFLLGSRLGAFFGATSEVIRLHKAAEIFEKLWHMPFSCF